MPNKSMANVAFIRKQLRAARGAPDSRFSEIAREARRRGVDFDSIFDNRTRGITDTQLRDRLAEFMIRR